jgi:hypothetical protein
MYVSICLVCSRLFFCNVCLLLLAIACLITSTTAQLEKYTQAQIEAALNAFAKNPRLNKNHICDIKGSEISCFVSLNETILGVPIVFNASVDAIANVANQSLQVKITVDGSVVLNKEYELEKLDIPICVPVLTPVQYFINLCADLTGIKWSKEKDCFKAELGVSLLLLHIRRVTLIPPQAFGHNVDKCQ